jgi:hypothetical protein
VPDRSKFHLESSISNEPKTKPKAETSSLSSSQGNLDIAMGQYMSKLKLYSSKYFLSKL